MKSFSLKKMDGAAADIDKSKIQKKGFSGFSLKKKIIEKKSPINVNNAFGESIVMDAKREVVITSTEDVFEVPKNEELLVIVPQRNSNSWEDRRREALEKLEKQEQEDILEKSRELNKDTLNYGINHQQKINEEKDNEDLKSRLEMATVKKNLSAGAYQPTSKSYEKVPVEKFGLAMLRGMGWTEEMEKTKKKKQGSEITEKKSIGSRPLLLGLGAKPLISGSPRVSDNHYVPVVRVQREKYQKDENDGRERFIGKDT